MVATQRHFSEVDIASLHIWRSMQGSIYWCG